MVESKLFEHTESSLDDLIRIMIEEMINAHAPDPELYELLMTEFRTRRRERGTSRCGFM